MASFNLNIITQNLSVSHTCEEEEIFAAISSASFKAQKTQYLESPKSTLKKYSNLLYTSVSGLVTLTGIVLIYFDFSDFIMLPIFVTAIISGGWKIFIKGFKVAKSLALDMNFLMTITIFGAVAIGKYAELPLLYLCSLWLYCWKHTVLSELGMQ